MTPETTMIIIGGVSSLLSGAFGVGAHWGVTKHRLRDMEKRQDQHEAKTKERLDEYEARLKEGDGRMTSMANSMAESGKQIAIVQTKLDSVGVSVKEIRDLIFKKLGDA